MRRYRDRASLDFLSWKLLENGGWLNWQWEEGANCLVSARCVRDWETPSCTTGARGLSLEKDEVSVGRTSTPTLTSSFDPLPLCQLLTPIKILDQEFSIASTSDIAGSWKWRQLVSNLGQPRSSRRIATMTMTIVKSCNPGLKHMEKMGNLKNRKNLEKTLTFYVCIFVKIITFTLSPPRRVQKALKCTDPFKILGYPL